MDLQQYLLGKLSEEASEVAQIALKNQQFGMREVFPGQPLTNADRAHLELDDLYAVVEMLNDMGFEYKPNRFRIDAKKDKVVKYLKYSVELGMVPEIALKEYDND